MAREITEMLIESVTLELPDTKTLRLKWPDGHNPDFKTGQFITLYWPDTPGYKRAYSLSSCALERGYYEVTVKRDGKMGTRIVDWAKPGDKMFVIPPVGKFLPILEPEKHLICIAGGSGVTPFRAFAREAALRHLDTEITVLYSVRNPSGIIFGSQFQEMEKQNPHFKFLVTCTRLLEDEAWAGHRGRITPEWVMHHVSDLKNTVFYACGPNALVEFAEQVVLHGIGAPKEQMKTEKWG
jgi:ferredoxin-NADP reductase